MSMPLFERRKLSGWGRRPTELCYMAAPETGADLSAIVRSGSQPSYIPRGLGRSYGDAALNRAAGVIGLTRLRQIFSFDKSRGLLECEAGASFAEIIQRFLPQGYFLPVTPGTKFVSVGGAIAADVHGKNHHSDGSLANFVSGFDLLTGSGEILHCSRSANREVFWATVGGMGLTGIILKAQFQLRRVETAWLRVDCQKASRLEEALETMAATDARYQYSVAWVDCLASGRRLGRSILMQANHATAKEPGIDARNCLQPPPKPRFKLHCDLPSFTLNSLSVRAFNSVYYRHHRDATSRLVHLEKFFYPLDAVEDWNRFYGRRGFVQYQVVLPFEGGGKALALLLGRLAESHRASFLAVLKRFGRGNPGLLSFPMEGYTLSLDLPATHGLEPFLHDLDRITLAHGGRIYLAKDAVQKPETFAAGYPRLGHFQKIRRELDPKGVFCSSLARRLGLAG
ncbi:MAG: FAD-binding protein [Terriglobia bacterium]